MGQNSPTVHSTYEPYDLYSLLSKGYNTFKGFKATNWVKGLYSSLLGLTTSKTPSLSFRSPEAALAWMNHGPPMSPASGVIRSKITSAGQRRLVAGQNMEDAPDPWIPQ